MPWRTKSHSELLGRSVRDRAYDEDRRAADPGLAGAKKMRSSARWQKLRAGFLRKHPLCRDPFGKHTEEHQVVAAQQVHHIEPIVERPDLAFEVSNLAALCIRCHREIEARERLGKATRNLFE